MVDGGEPAALLDNHATANLIWSLVPPERRFDPEVMARINELRATIVSAATELSPPEHSLVFTNFIPSHTPGSVLEPHRRLAHARCCQLVAVVLHCDPDEVLRRVPAADRRERLKLVDPDIARVVMDRGQSLPDWPELTDLDITGLTAAEAASKIIGIAGA